MLLLCKKDIVWTKQKTFWCFSIFPLPGQTLIRPPVIRGLDTVREGFSAFFKCQVAAGKGQHTVLSWWKQREDNSELKNAKSQWISQTNTLGWPGTQRAAFVARKSLVGSHQGSPRKMIIQCEQTRKILCFRFFIHRKWGS